MSLIRLFAAVLFCSVHHAGFQNLQGVDRGAGPATETISLEAYQQLRYVSQAVGSDADGEGSAEMPWQTIRHALAQITDAAENRRYAVLVSSGLYAGTSIQLKEYVDLYGGFDPEGWQRDIFAHQTILDGEGKRCVLVGADQSRLDGFVIRNGLVRGKGAGLLCESVSPVVTNNVFVSNRTLAPEPWNPKYRHEIANDGAAIYCENGASPVIENNIFARNGTEAGRGGGIALHKKCSGRIANNVFLYNTVGSNDPKRSSDGGAISVFDWCKPTIENNIFLENQALNQNDGGGVFVALWSSPIIRKNIFVANRCDDDGGALFVGGQEHRYDRPLDPLPPADEFFVTIVDNVFIGNRNPSMNSGAMRLTMESRGRFANNVVAHNTGIYFQRSEVEVINNTILENFLFVETKKGLRPGKIVNNIILGKFDLRTEAEVSRNMLPLPIRKEDNLMAAPLFENDWVELKAEKVSYDPSRALTEIYAAQVAFADGTLVGRVVQAGDNWGVVKENRQRSLTIWGDLTGEVKFIILPSYHLRVDSPGVDQGNATLVPVVDIDGDRRPAGKGVDIGADEVKRP